MNDHWNHRCPERSVAHWQDITPGQGTMLKSLIHLKLTLTQVGKDLQISFNWKAGTAGFKLPVSVTTAKNTFGFIYPTAINQFLTIRDMEVDEFKVDQENFYFDLDMHVISSNTSK